MQDHVGSLAVPEAHTTTQQHNIRRGREPQRGGRGWSQRGG